MFLHAGFSWSTLADGLENSDPNSNSSALASGAGAGAGAGGRRGAGWYVKRVEITAGMWTEELANDAARVVRACPNLKVVSVGSADEAPVPHVLVQAVLETCPQALRGLDWTCGLDAESLKWILDGIGHMSELRTLFLCVEEDVFPAEFPQVKVALPKLHTLELVSADFDPSDVLVTMAGWDLPALRQVTLTGQGDLRVPGPFFWVHGHKLKTLEFDYAGMLQVPPEGVAFEPSTGPEVLLLNCDSLSELVLSLHWAQLQASPGHASVEYIGLRGLHLLSHKQAHAQSRNPVTGSMILRPDQDFEQKAAIAALERLFPLLLTSTSTPLPSCLGGCNSTTASPPPSITQTETYGEQQKKQQQQPLRICTCRSTPRLTLFPRLHAIRLLDFDQARFHEIPWRAKRVAFWRIWIKRFEERGVRLEDHQGGLVRVDFKDVRVYLPEDEREWRAVRNREWRTRMVAQMRAAAGQQGQGNQVGNAGSGAGAGAPAPAPVAVPAPVPAQAV